MPRRWVGAASRNRSRPAGGENGLRAAGIGQARVSLDRSVRDEAVDQSGHAAPAQQDPIGELVHPEPAAGRLGELEERVILGERQVMFGAEVLVEEPLEAGMGDQEVAPRRDTRVARRNGAADPRSRHEVMIPAER